MVADIVKFGEITAEVKKEYNTKNSDKFLVLNEKDYFIAVKISKNETEALKEVMQFLMNRNKKIHSLQGLAKKITIKMKSK